MNRGSRGPEPRIITKLDYDPRRRVGGQLLLINDALGLRDDVFYVHVEHDLSYVGAVLSRPEYTVNN